MVNHHEITIWDNSILYYFTVLFSKRLNKPNPKMETYYFIHHLLQQHFSTIQALSLSLSLGAGVVFIHVLKPKVPKAKPGAGCFMQRFVQPH